MIDRKFFFDAIRYSLFGGKLTIKQTEGMNAILDEWDTGKWQGNLNRLAYMLATAFHETAQTMQPIIERGSRAYFNKYEPNTKLGKVLGNDKMGDGYLYRGRGFVQLTGRRNYALAGDRISVNLVNKPELACDMGNAVKIMFNGMFEGWFTGLKLGDYFTQDKRDWANARKIINGLDKAYEIGIIARKFRIALRVKL